MYSMKGRTGQGFCSPKPRFTIDEVKALNPARHYYPGQLEGRFGRMGVTGWCEWNGLCPFHDDHRPGSVSINLSTGAFKCFACGASAGDVLAFHAKRHGLTLRETLVALGGGQ